MTFLLILFALSAALELLMYTKGFWSYRKSLSVLVLVSVFFQAGMVLGAFSLVVVEVFVAGLLYRVTNILRVYTDRTHEKQLRRTGLRSFCIITALQAVVLLSIYAPVSVSLLTWLYALSTLCVEVSLMLLLTAYRSRQKMQVVPVNHGFASRDLPTVTVAIPARNETEDLQACLSSLIASNYQKLEFIVLDDCSQVRRTPEIIRNFAHDGVRFIAGITPPEQWLAKNYAYKQLSDEANGEYILFCGVDARFEPQTISKIVESMLLQDRSMVSVMPVNEQPAGSIAALLVQPMRYAWEIAVPRRWSQRPPLLSTCWVISKEFLDDVGGLQAVTRTILPERYFARRAHNKGAYSFYYADQQIGLRCIKSAAEQRETAVRMRYPQLHRRPEYALLLSVVELTLLLGPSLIAVYALLHGYWLLLSLTVAAVALFNFLYVYVAQLTYRRWSMFSPILMPLALLYDVYLLNLSMYRYEFSDVYWKGRNVCIPVLQAYPTLPKLK